jgi:Uma2 family endonuclease
MTTILEQLTGTEEPVRQDQAPVLRLFTVKEYDRMREAGILGEDERVELLEGRIIKMSPKGIKHAVANDRASRCFFKHFGDRVIVRNQNPIHLDYASEPEPDLVLAVPQEKEYSDHHPTSSDILFVLEIADSSLSVDRQTKSRLYAAAGIIQYSVLNLKAGELEDYRDPGLDDYRSKQTYKAEQSFSLVAFPEIEINVSELLPPE